MNKEIHTVIIGSGISGLSFAHFLSKSTQDFLVLESDSRVGGIIHTERKNHLGTILRGWIVWHLLPRAWISGYT